jgi:hypothetical protein
VTHVNASTYLQAERKIVFLCGIQYIFIIIIIIIIIIIDLCSKKK